MKDQVLNDAVAAGRAALNESEGKALLAAHGIRVPGSVVVGTPEEVTGAIAGMTGRCNRGGHPRYVERTNDC